MRDSSGKTLGLAFSGGLSRRAARTATVEHGPMPRAENGAHRCPEPRGMRKEQAAAREAGGPAADTAMTLEPFREV